MNWRCGTSEMVDLVDFKQERLDDVVSDELEIRVTKVVHHVFFPSREEIIYNDHAVAPRDQTVHEVRPDEPRPTRDDYSKPLPFQPQGNLPARIHRPEPDARVVGSLVRLDGVIRQRIRDRYVAAGPTVRGGIRRRNDGKKQGGDSNADEDEHESLLAEHVANRLGHGEPWLDGFRGIRIRRQLTVVASVYELRPHPREFLITPHLAPMSRLADQREKKYKREGEFFTSYS